MSNKVKSYVNVNRSKGTQSFLVLGKLRELPVPVISNPVMKKLIQFLDNFDTICSDLNIGLPAEIEARQKQYEYYRNALLTYAATSKIIAQTDKHNALIKLCQYVFYVVFLRLL